MARLSSPVVISIVDDDESMRIAMKDMVETLGYAVVTFASGLELLRSDSLHSTACLISDVRMPGMDGLELQSRLIASGHSIPIIFLTAFPEAKLHDRAVRAGAIAFLSKPCRREELLIHIRTAIASRNTDDSDPKGK